MDQKLLGDSFCSMGSPSRSSRSSALSVLSSLLANLPMQRPRVLDWPKEETFRGQGRSDDDLGTLPLRNRIRHAATKATSGMDRQKLCQQLSSLNSCRDAVSIELSAAERKPKANTAVPAKCSWLHALASHFLDIGGLKLLPARQHPQGCLSA